MVGLKNGRLQTHLFLHAGPAHSIRRRNYSSSRRNAGNADIVITPPPPGSFPGAFPMLPDVYPGQDQNGPGNAAHGPTYPKTPGIFPGFSMRLCYEAVSVPVLAFLVSRCKHTRPPTNAPETGSSDARMRLYVSLRLPPGGLAPWIFHFLGVIFIFTRKIPHFCALFLWGQISARFPS